MGLSAEVSVKVAAFYNRQGPCDKSLKALGKEIAGIPEYLWFKFLNALGTYKDHFPEKAIRAIRLTNDGRYRDLFNACAANFGEKEIFNEYLQNLPVYWTDQHFGSITRISKILTVISNLPEPYKDFVNLLVRGTLYNLKNFEPTSREALELIKKIEILAHFAAAFSRDVPLVYFRESLRGLCGGSSLSLHALPIEQLLYLLRDAFPKVSQDQQAILLKHFSLLCPKGSPSTSVDLAQYIDSLSKLNRICPEPVIARYNQTFSNSNQLNEIQGQLRSIDQLEIVHKAFQCKRRIERFNSLILEAHLLGGSIENFQASLEQNEEVIGALISYDVQNSYADIGEDQAFLKQFPTLKRQEIEKAKQDFNRRRNREILERMSSYLPRGQRQTVMRLFSAEISEGRVHIKKQHGELVQEFERYETNQNLLGPFRACFGTAFKNVETFKNPNEFMLALNLKNAQVEAGIDELNTQLEDLRRLGLENRIAGCLLREIDPNIDIRMTIEILRSLSLSTFIPDDPVLDDLQIREKFQKDMINELHKCIATLQQSNPLQVVKGASVGIRVKALKSIAYFKELSGVAAAMQEQKEPIKKSLQYNSLLDHVSLANLTEAFKILAFAKEVELYLIAKGFPPNSPQFAHLSWYFNRNDVTLEVKENFRRNKLDPLIDALKAHQAIWTLRNDGAISLEFYNKALSIYLRKLQSESVFFGDLDNQDRCLENAVEESRLEAYLSSMGILFKKYSLIYLKGKNVGERIAFANSSTEDKINALVPILRNEHAQEAIDVLVVSPSNAPIEQRLQTLILYDSWRTKIAETASMHACAPFFKALGLLLPSDTGRPELVRMVSKLYGHYEALAKKIGRRLPTNPFETAGLALSLHIESKPFTPTAQGSIMLMSELVSKLTLGDTFSFGTSDEDLKLNIQVFKAFLKLYANKKVDPKIAEMPAFQDFVEHFGKDLVKKDEILEKNDALTAFLNIFDLSIGYFTRWAKEIGNGDVRYHYIHIIRAFYSHFQLGSTLTKNRKITSGDIDFLEITIRREAKPEIDVGKMINDIHANPYNLLATVFFSIFEGLLGSEREHEAVKLRKKLDAHASTLNHFIAGTPFQNYLKMIPNLQGIFTIDGNHEKVKAVVFPFISSSLENNIKLIASGKYEQITPLLKSAFDLIENAFNKIPEAKKAAEEEIEMEDLENSDIENPTEKIHLDMDKVKTGATLVKFTLPFIKALYVCTPAVITLIKWSRPLITKILNSFILKTNYFTKEIKIDYTKEIDEIKKQQLEIDQRERIKVILKNFTGPLIDMLLVSLDKIIENHPPAEYDKYMHYLADVGRKGKLDKNEFSLKTLQFLMHLTKDLETDTSLFTGLIKGLYKQYPAL